MSQQHPIDLLRSLWRHREFRPGQEEIINAVLSGQDTVALLPTGGGKSICFQIPALMQDGICVVISPLVALMTDQVDRLAKLGIRAMHLSGGISQNDLVDQLDNIRYGPYKLLYLSPERLRQPIVLEALRKININLIAIDEAHCISQWGNDFRPAYRDIHQLRELHPDVAILALTATATPLVLQDTIENLQLRDPQVFKTSFIRHNLALEMAQADDKLKALVNLIENQKGLTIVYVRSRRYTEELASKLAQHGIGAHYYHGGLSREERLDKARAWAREQTPVMVATNAFGMGIDQANVRSVVHLQLPDSLESYYQEAGRAGRDGELARAVILYNQTDKDLAWDQFVSAQPGVKEIKVIYRQLSNYLQVAYGEGSDREFPFDFGDFCQSYGFPTHRAFAALKVLDRLGLIRLNEQFGRSSVIRFISSSEELLDYFERNPEASLVGKSILRMYGGSFETPVSLKLSQLSRRLSVKEDRLVHILEQMAKDGMLELNLQLTDATVTYLQPREDDRGINPFNKEITDLISVKSSQLRAVYDYLDTTHCLMRQLVSYFGESTEKDCGLCTNCRRPPQDHADETTIKQAVIMELKEGPSDSRDLCEKLNFDEASILNVLRVLLADGRIRVNQLNQFETE